MKAVLPSRRVTCPGCGQPMQTRDRHGVEIDQCPRCRGVWLDRGELDRIIERSSRFLELPGEEADHVERHHRSPAD